MKCLSAVGYQGPITPLCSRDPDGSAASKPPRARPCHSSHSAGDPGHVTREPVVHGVHCAIMRGPGHEVPSPAALADTREDSVHR